MIKRQIYQKIYEHMNRPEITILVGSRQVGKTTIANLLKNELEKKGERTLFINLDVESDYSLLESQDKFLFYLENTIGKTKAYIFIDEIQKKVNAGSFLKGLYDMSLPYKFIVTGSGSLELKETISESLAGRKKEFEISTLSFSEYFDFKTNYKFENNLDNYAKLFPEKLDNILTEYLTYGGYPKLTQFETTTDKYSEIEGIFNTFLLRDITGLLNIQKTEAFRKLLRNLANMDGSLVNISALSNQVDLSIPTLEKYLWYLEKTFIITRLEPFYKNPLKEINKSFIYYFNDIGLKNFLAGTFTNPVNRQNFSFDFQNFVFLILKQFIQSKAPMQLNYWRSKDKAEVDFVLRFANLEIPIEVKYTNLTKPESSRSYTSFINHYAPKYGFIINKTFSSTLKISESKIGFINYAQIYKSLNKIFENFPG